MSAQAAGQGQTGDALIVRRLNAIGFDALLSLDLHRQREVWSSMYLELAEGRGRLVRIRPTRREVPSVAVLTRYWARAAERIDELLQNSQIALIQIGHEATNGRPIRGGVRGYSRRQIALMTQQVITTSPIGELRAQGSPRIRE